MIVCFGLITLIYVSTITGLSWGFIKVPLYIKKEKTPQIKFSVIIPFRNESKNLVPLLASLQDLEYPNTHFEVICVDDASEDTSVSTINNFLRTQQTPIPLSILSNIRKTNAPKKDAITTAIANAKYDWVITTDADCLLPKYWLERFNSYIQHTNALCVAGPVMYTQEDTFLNRFQILDFISLQGATIGGFGLKQPFLCNGANLAYKKSLFTAVKGFKGNTAISSGDDIFLLEKALAYAPQQVHYLKSKKAIVKTHAQHSWHDLLQQRVRWAAKTGAYKSIFAKTVGLSVFTLNFSLIILPLLSFFGLVFLKMWSGILLLKLLADGFLFSTALRFFKPKKILRSFLLSFSLYPIFSSYVALLTLSKAYQWKGRTFKK